MFSRAQMGWQPCAWAGSLSGGGRWFLEKNLIQDSLMPSTDRALSPREQVWRDFSPRAEPSVECLFNSAPESSCTTGGDPPW